MNKLKVISSIPAVRFAGVFLFRVVVGWVALRWAGFEYDPHQVALILLTGWIMFYGLGGKQVTTLVYKGRDAS